MMRSIDKRISELDSWDLDAGCRNIVNQATKARRRLKKKIRKMDRKRLDKFYKLVYNTDTDRGKDE